MLGRIGNGGLNSVRVRVGELPAARPTKALPARHLGSAMRTVPGKSCAAIAAKLRATWALTVTVVASRHSHFFHKLRTIDPTISSKFQLARRRYIRSHHCYLALNQS